MNSNRHIKTPNLRPRLRASGLVLPLIAFVGFTFAAPLATMLVRSVYDPVVADAMPRTLALLKEWDGQGAPHEAVYESAARELVKARAAASLGAGPVRIFRRVQLPLIAPGVISGALFAFATSFDEVVVVLFMAAIEQRTIPRQMWASIREQISPTILAVATFLIVFAVLLLFAVEWMRRRSASR